MWKCRVSVRFSQAVAGNRLPSSVTFHRDSLTLIARMLLAGFEARASFRFTDSCWWRPLAVDGGSGNLGGTPRLSIALVLNLSGKVTKYVLRFPSAKGDAHCRDALVSCLVDLGATIGTSQRHFLIRRNRWLSPSFLHLFPGLASGLTDQAVIGGRTPGASIWSQAC